MVDPETSKPLRILKALDGFLKAPCELIPRVPEIEEAFKKNADWLRRIKES
jgi:hypothetical protein